MFQLLSSITRLIQFRRDDVMIIAGEENTRRAEKFNSVMIVRRGEIHASPTFPQDGHPHMFRSFSRRTDAMN